MSSSPEISIELTLVAQDPHDFSFPQLLLDLAGAVEEDHFFDFRQRQLAADIVVALIDKWGKEKITGWLLPEGKGRQTIIDGIKHSHLARNVPDADEVADAIIEALIDNIEADKSAATVFDNNRHSFFSQAVSSFGRLIAQQGVPTRSAEDKMLISMCK